MLLGRGKGGMKVSCGKLCAACASNQKGRGEWKSLRVESRAPLKQEENGVVSSGKSYASW